MDAALLLLKPDGVISVDVEYAFDDTHRFTKYAVDLYLTDVPIFCYQGITIGSNTVDFLTQTPIDHGLENLYFDPTKQVKNHYNMWYNFRRNNTDNGLCRDVLTEAKDLPEQSTAGETGVLLILEAEDALLPLDSPRSVQAAISQALKKAGLTETSAQSFGGTFVFILKEGYAVARTWPELKYCAFDVMLWSNFDKLDAAKTELVTSMGSKGKSTSSYRVVTSGMFGVSPGDRHNFCQSKTDLRADAVHPIRNGPVKENVVDTVPAKSLSLIQDTAAGVVVVFCGEQKGPCSTLQALEKIVPQFQKVVPLWTCPGLSAVSSVETTESVMQQMYACEVDILRSLNELKEKDVEIVGIVIAPEAPRWLGQILHKILSSPKVRGPLLSDNYVVLAASSDQTGIAWRRALLDRFRVEFECDPAFRAEIVFNGTDSSFELDVFSSGDEEFYLHLVDTVKSVEKEADLKSEILLVKNARNSYIADFEPSFVATRGDYDQNDYNEQWSSQRPLGRQTIFQFDSNRTLTKDQVEAGFRSSLQSIDETNMGNVEVHLYDVGDGCTIVDLWTGGSVVLLWNGKTRVDINLFTNDVDEDIHDNLELVLMEKIPSLDVISRDDQPRGLGRVVLFEHEMESQYGGPIGDQGHFDADDTDDSHDEHSANSDDIDEADVNQDHDDEL